MLCCSSTLGNSEMLWERVYEKLMTIHCILTGVCLRKAHKETLQQSQRKNTQFMPSTLIFWGAPCLSDFASHNPVQVPLVPKLWGVCRAMQPYGHDRCGGMTALQTLTNTARKLQRRVGYLRVPNITTWVQGCSASHEGWACVESPTVGYSPWGQSESFWRINALHIMRKATPALGSPSLAMGCTAPAQSTTTVMAMTRPATVIWAFTCCSQPQMQDGGAIC